MRGVLLLLACLFAPAAAPDPAWRPVLEGRLPNGVRYAVLPRRAREPGAGLLIRIEGGFIAERRPGERGLTHLIEHLALVSPTADAPGEPRRFLRIGLPLTFPAPTAGTNSWRETNLFFSTRTTKPADLDTMLGLIRGVAGDMTLPAELIDEQRADVAREMAGRRPGNVVHAAFIAAVAPGSPNDVIDAQNHDDVPTASAGTIRALYRRLYRPENVMIVVVGDVDAAATAATIRRRFGGWRGAGPKPGRAAHPTFRRERIAPISWSALKEGRTSAMISVASPTPAPPASRQAQARATLMDMAAVRAVNDRLMQAEPGAPPGKVGLFIENGEQGHRLFLMWDNAAPGRWRSAVAGLKRATCALNGAGFSQAAWAAAVRGVTEELERRTRDMADAPNVELATHLSHALVDGRALLPPDELLRQARAWLPGVDARAASGWWRREWRAGTEHLRVESPELAAERDPRAAIRAAIVEGEGGAGTGRPAC